MLSFHSSRPRSTTYNVVPAGYCIQSMLESKVKDKDVVFDVVVLEISINISEDFGLLWKRLHLLRPAALLVCVGPYAVSSSEHNTGTLGMHMGLNLMWCVSGLSLWRRLEVGGDAESLRFQDGGTQDW